MPPIGDSLLQSLDEVVKMVVPIQVWIYLHLLDPGMTKGSVNASGIKPEISRCALATTATDLPAYLKAWIDWNGKGALGSRRAGGQQHGAQWSPFSQCFPVTVPASTVQDQDLGLRVRLTSCSAGPTGLAIGGEVEDYLIRVACPDEPYLPAQISR